jgi:hypothetical protein
LSPKTPAEWLSYLDSKLAEQQREIDIFERYYRGDHALAYATEKFKQTFGDLFPAFADNWCQTVVDAPVERLGINGFRCSSKALTKQARAVWQSNRLDAGSVLAHTEAVKDGRSYLIVQPGTSARPARITVEHPSQVYVEHAPGDRRERIAAIKKWTDSAGYSYATLYFPDRILKFKSGRGIIGFGAAPLVLPANYDPTGWEPRGQEAEGVNPLRVVPVIPLYNSPTMLEDGQSDLVTAIPLNDAINKESMDMLIASEYAAFRQRVLTGIEVPTVKDPDTGNELPDPALELRMSVSRLIAIEDKDVGVHEFAASDLKNYVEAVTMFLQHLAAQTRTPPHYLLGQIVNASGDALKAAETGLVAKVKRKQLDFADSWEEAIGLALGKNSDTIETVWADPEYRSEGELVDGLVKLASIGVPKKALFERIATPEQAEQWLSEQPAAEAPPTSPDVNPTA